MKTNGGYYFPIPKIDRDENPTHKGITRRNKLIGELMCCITSACIDPQRTFNSQMIFTKIEKEGLPLAEKIADLVIGRTTFEDDI